MHLLTILLAAVLAAVAVPVVRGLMPEGGRARPWTVGLLAVPIAAILGWSAGRVADLSIPSAIGLALVAVALAVQFVVDLSTHRLPREVSYAGLVAFAVTVPFAGADSVRLVHAVIGALVMTSITLGLVLLTRGSMGVGDVHLSPLLGALAGWFGFLAAIGVAWVVTAITGGVVVAAGLALGRLDRGTHVPYGPFLIVGALAACVVSAVGQ